MNKFTGTAILEYRGETRQVYVCLDLDENVIEVRHTMPNITKALSIINDRDRDTSPVILTDIRIVTPIGIISKNRSTDFFMTSHSTGSYSSPESILTRVLTLHTKEEGVTRVVLHSRSSEVEFEFQPFDVLTPQYEMFLRGAESSTILPQPFELQLNPGRAVLVPKARGIIVRGDQSLSNSEEFIRLSLGILQGGPVTIHSLLENKMLTINLSSHDGKSIGHLYKNDKDAGTLLQGIYNFLSAQPLADWERWKRGIYFYLQGLGGTAPLEIRTINLYTFLEMIDNRDDLEKNSIAALLHVKTDEADLICRTRNRLIHNGYNIGAALLESENTISEHKKPLNNTVIFIDHMDEHNTGVRFYFAFARLLNKLIVEKAGFTGDWNDYSEYDI
jgi:hypothetical protein